LEHKNVSTYRHHQAHVPVKLSHAFEHPTARFGLVDASQGVHPGFAFTEKIEFRKSSFISFVRSFWYRKSDF
jgi:hypothetical protein